MQSSCLMCISTLLESGNHYSRMCELRDQTTGEPLFETIQISLCVHNAACLSRPVLTLCSFSLSFSLSGSVMIACAQITPRRKSASFLHGSTSGVSLG